MSLDDVSLSELFRIEAAAQVHALGDGLIALDDAVTAERLEVLMRAAHSLKGAARIVGHEAIVSVAHELEESFVAAQAGRLALTPARVDVLLRGVDAIARLAATEPGVDALPADIEAEVLPALKAVARGEGDGSPAVVAPSAAAARVAPRVTRGVGSAPAEAAPAAPSPAAPAADHTDALLVLAGEALVASRVLLASTAGDLTSRRSHGELERALADLRVSLGDAATGAEVQRAMHGIELAVTNAVQRRRERSAELEVVAQRLADSVSQLYGNVLDGRMRRFGTGVAGMPRMVRDTARELGRDVRLVILGEGTPVDREVLRRIEAPLGHLMRNAVDHGVESPAERVAQGKPARGTITLEARHGGGRLLVSVEDDGRGIDLEAVRARVVQRGLADAASSVGMSEQELSHFLFLPGFTLRDAVTSISGRGVGLDAVQTAVREIGGDVRVVRGAAGGTRFELQLPLTLSVVRALVVAVSGESFAVPLARVQRITRVPRDAIASAEGRQHFPLDDRPVGLVFAHELLGLPPAAAASDAAVVVIGDHESALGVVVDRFVGEQELVLRGLDARLGKVQDIAGAALLADGSPTLVLDVDDLQRTATNLLAGGGPSPVRREGAAAVARKRVLVVDDSLTVRELERKMIEARGYEVDVAVDGMDGWNALRGGRYDLVVTDVDMPRMDGIELVTRIKADPALRTTPVMIVSYKDRDEDRLRGLDAGADYYLTKGSFYDETMLRAIEDFIGSAT